MSLWQKHAILEKNSIILVIGILIVIAIGGLVEIVPLFYLKNTIEKVDGVRPYTPLELAGRDIYVREGCYLCHSQMIRPLRWCSQLATTATWTGPGPSSWTATTNPGAGRASRNAPCPRREITITAIAAGRTRPALISAISAPPQPTPAPRVGAITAWTWATGTSSR